MDRLAFISEIARILIRLDTFADRMAAVLTLVGTEFGVSRVYIYEDSPDKTSSSITYEWTNEGISPIKPQYRCVKYRDVPEWRMKILQSGGFSMLHSDVLIPEAKQELEAEHVYSVVVYPLHVHQQIRGFIGCDECIRPTDWASEESDVFLTISGLISNAYERDVVEHALRQIHKNFQTFFETINDVLIIANLDGSLLYGNSALKEILGYSTEDIEKMSIFQLHPPEEREKEEEIFRNILMGNREPSTINGLCKDGTIIPLEVRGWLGLWDETPCMFGIARNISREQEALLKFSQLFNNNPQLMIIGTYPDIKITDVNDAFVQRLGYHREELIGTTYQERNMIIDSEQKKEIIETLIAQNNVKNIPVKIRCKNGSVLEGLFSGTVLDLVSTRLIVIVIADISEQVELSRTLDHERQRLTNIIEGTQLGTWEWDMPNNALYCNEQWARMLGYSLKEIEPCSYQTWEFFVHPDDLQKANEALHWYIEDFDTRTYSAQFRMRHKNGAWIWIQSKGKVLEHDDDFNPLRMFGTHVDISESKSLEYRLREASIHDPLTDLYNRRYLYERLSGLLSEYRRRKEPFSVTLIDIDHFKNLNDTYGHLAGDVVLKELSLIFQQKIRPYDIAARYGGEEFVIVSINETKLNACISIARILETIQSHVFTFAGKEVRVTFSAGIVDAAEFIHGELNEEILLARADQRLYLAKTTGRNRIVREDAVELEAD